MLENLKDKVLSILGVTASGSVSGLDPVTLARIVDISHWEGDADIARMVTEGDIAMAIFKASDGNQLQKGDPTYPPNYVDDWFFRNVDKAYNANIACGVYHYVIPYFANYTVQGVADWNMECLHAALDKLVPKVSYHLIVLDVEEKIGTEPNRSDVVLKMMDAIAKDPKMSKVPLAVYTSVSILDAYYPKLRDQLSYVGANKNLWLAQWPVNTAQTITWEYLINTVMPKLSMKVLTPGYADWKILQWASCYTLPGCTAAIDLNFYKGSKAALYTWLGYTPKTPVDTTAPTIPTGLTATVTDNSITISWSPSTDNLAVMGYKVYKDAVQVTATTGTSVTLSGLLPGLFTFGVSAYDAAGNESSQATVSATVGGGTTGDITRAEFDALTARVTELERWRRS